MSDEILTIAIDGPSGAGKSTVARRVAERLGLRYLDSGALYRAVGLSVIEAGVDAGNAPAVERLLAGLNVSLASDGKRVLVNGRDVTSLLRSEEVSQAASKVSSQTAVRQFLIDVQRAAATPPGVVVEGRDMGTVVFPNANVKVFLDAEPGERARRRTAELSSRGVEAALPRIRADMEERDRRDRGRRLAPLVAAPDALRIDSTGLTIDQVVEHIVQAVSTAKSGN